MALRRGKSSAPPSKLETAAELAQLIQSHAIKLLDRGNGEMADWPLIAEAALKVAFDALDKLPGDPRTHRLLLRVHSGAENRITQSPAYERETFHADASRATLNAWGTDGPGLHRPGE